MLPSLNSEYKLELLQVMFRHGERTPDVKEIYETDPYVSIVEKLGHGQLTELGAERMRRVGQVLRERYNDFLGEFRCEDIHAQTTDIQRTRVSLQNVLSTLYPANTLRNIDADLSHVPVHCESENTDLFRSYLRCSRYTKMFFELMDNIQQRLNLSQKFLDHVTNSTKVKAHRSLFTLYFNIKAYLSLGLPLPDWCTEDDYKQIERIGQDAILAVTETDLMKRITAGVIIEMFLENINSHEHGGSKKKIHLYSAHDLNICSFTSVHDFENIPVVPDFGSTIVIEKLRGPDDKIYIRILLWTGESEQWIALKFENGRYECPLSNYKKMIESVLPDDESREYNLADVFLNNK